jgi:hypothetical protein
LGQWVPDILKYHRAFIIRASSARQLVKGTGVLVYGYGKQMADELGDSTGEGVGGAWCTDVFLKRCIVGCCMVKELLLKVKVP